MAVLPDKNDIIDNATTEVEFQDAMSDLYDFVEQIALSGPAEALEIDASGVIVPTQSVVQIDTNNSAATDNLDLITTTSIGEKVIFIRSTSAARVITLRHNQSGSGKLWLNGATDVVLRSPTYCIALLWNATNSRWEELFRNFGLYVTDSSEITAIKTLLGLGTASAVDTGTDPTDVPQNSDLGSAAYVDTGTDPTDVPQNSDLGSFAYKSSILNTDLPNSGVSAGTYNSVTVNTKGIVTAASNVTVSNGLVLLASTTSSNVSSLNLTSVLSSTYDDYLIFVDQISSINGNTELYMRVSTNNGSSYVSSASYAYCHSNQKMISASPTPTYVAHEADSKIIMSKENSPTGQAGTGLIRLHNMNSDVYKRISWELNWRNNSANEVMIQGAGVYQGTSAINAVQFYLNSGNIDKAYFRLYGISKT